MKVALSGDGGDEFFAGYPILGGWRSSISSIACRGPLRKLMRLTANALPYSAYGKNFLHAIGSPTALDRYFNQNYVPYFLRKRMLNSEVDAAGRCRHFSQQMLPDNFLPDGTDIRSQPMYFEATNLLTGDFLAKVDRASMAASLEVRCPLLDHRFAEFATGIPTKWKWQNGKGKKILLEALGDRLPPELLTRPKMGFGVPIDHWFRGPLRELVHDSLLGKQLPRSRNRVAGLRALPAGGTRQRPPQQSSSDLRVTHVGAVVQEFGRTAQGREPDRSLCDRRILKIATKLINIARTLILALLDVPEWQLPWLISRVDPGIPADGWRLVFVTHLDEAVCRSDPFNSPLGVHGSH